MANGTDASNQVSKIYHELCTSTATSIVFKNYEKIID